MDPLSIVTGSVTLATLCGQCVVFLTRWIGEIRSVDSTILGFCDEIQALKGVLESLEWVTGTGPMREVAKLAEANESNVLWTQIERSTSDVRVTLTRLKEILNRIGRGQWLVRQFKTSLQSGEIALLRQRIVLLNSTLNLPLQMLSIYMQAEGKMTANSYDRDMAVKVDSLHRMVSDIQNSLQNRRTQESDDLTTEEKEIYTHAHELLESARGFASNASTISTQSSSISTATGIEASLPLRPIPDSLAGENLESERYEEIAQWIPTAPWKTVTSPINDTLSASSMTSSGDGDSASIPYTPILEPEPFVSTEDFDLEIRLLENRLEKGRSYYEAGKYLRAIPFLQTALETMAEPKFKSGTSLTVGDAQLILARTYLQLGRLDDAENLLAALKSESSWLDPPDILSTEHLLAQNLVRQGSLERAHSLCLETTKRRQRLLGLSNPLFHESATLLAEIYEILGNASEAEIWQDMVPRQRSSRVDSFIWKSQQIEILHAQGKSEEAADLAMKCLKAYPINKERIWIPEDWMKSILSGLEAVSEEVVKD